MGIRDDDVGGVIHHERLVTRPAYHRIDTRSCHQRIVGACPNQGVIARACVNPVVEVGARERFVASRAVEVEAARDQLAIGEHGAVGELEGLNRASIERIGGVEALDANLITVAAYVQQERACTDAKGDHVGGDARAES